MNSILIATLAGLGGMLGWGLADFFAKKTIDQIGDVVTLVWGHIFGTILIICISIYVFFANGHGIEVPTNSITWIDLFLFGALQAIVYLLVYKGFGKGQLALLNPIFASYSGVVALFTILVFGEIVTGHIVISLITIFAGILLLNIDGEALKKGRVNFLRLPGFKEVMTAALLAAVWTIGWDRFIMGNDWLSYAAYMYLFMSLTLLIYVYLKKIRLDVVKVHLWKYVILIGIFETIAYMSISWGFGTAAHPSIVVLLSGAFSLPTIFLARTFLKEKTTRLQTIGSLVIILGIILLSV